MMTMKLMMKMLMEIIMIIKNKKLKVVKNHVKKLELVNNKKQIIVFALTLLLHNKIISVKKRLVDYQDLFKIVKKIFVIYAAINRCLQIKKILKMYAWQSVCLKKLSRIKLIHNVLIAKIQKNLYRLCALCNSQPKKRNLKLINVKLISVIFAVFYIH